MVYPRSTVLENSSAEKFLGVLLNTKLNVSQQCVLSAKKVYSILGYIRRSVTSSRRDDPFSLLSTGEAVTGVLYLVWM